MIAPPQMLVFERCEIAEPVHVSVERAWGEGEQRPQQRHVHRSQQDPHNPGGGSIATALGITAEGGQPQEQAGDDKRPLLGREPDGVVARRLVQGRRMPGPYHGEFHHRSRDWGE